MHNLTEEQKKDITNRIEAAKKYLADNGLAVSAQVLSPNLGLVDPKFNNLFAFGVHAFLTDIKYASEAAKTDAPAS